MPRGSGPISVDAMLWVVHCLDAPDVLPLRHASRAEHSARLRSGLVDPVLYGPLVQPDGSTPTGSLILLRAPDVATVESYVAEDPFRTKGIWRQVAVSGFVESANSPARIAQREAR